jgi:hypothetical protein
MANGAQFWFWNWAGEEVGEMRAGAGASNQTSPKAIWPEASAINPKKT